MLAAMRVHGDRLTSSLPAWSSVSWCGGVCLTVVVVCLVRRGCFRLWEFVVSSPSRQKAEAWGKKNGGKWDVNAKQIKDNTLTRHSNLCGVFSLLRVYVSLSLVHPASYTFYMVKKLFFFSSSTLSCSHVAAKSRKSLTQREKKMIRLLSRCWIHGKFSSSIALLHHFLFGKLPAPVFSSSTSPPFVVDNSAYFSSFVWLCFCRAYVLINNAWAQPSYTCMGFLMFFF